MENMVVGGGVSSKGDYPVTINGKVTQEYSKWYDMLNRCYNPEVHKKNYTYRDCEVSEELKDYQTFAEFYNNELLPETKLFTDPFDLDKDILPIISGEYRNKLYSKETVMLVPRRLNRLISTKPNRDTVLKYLYENHKNLSPRLIQALEAYNPRRVGFNW